MVEHIKQLMKQLTSGEFRNFGTMRQQVRELHHEVNGLSPQDFEPGVRAELVTFRGRLAHFGQVGSFSEEAVQEVVRKALPVFDQYRGRGSGGSGRAFPY